MRMTMMPAQTEKVAFDLMQLADKVAPEGEPLDLTDRDMTLDELVQLRSQLSSWRKAIDLANKALAKYWDEKFPGQKFDNGYGEWSVGNTKMKELVGDDLFMEFLASKDADGLKRLFTPSRLATVVKVSGMTPAERDTFISEVFTDAGLSINRKEKR